MLRWFKDAGLTSPVTNDSPKWVSIPLAGASKTISLWLGDDYYTTVKSAVAISASTINLVQTDDLAVSGTVKIGTDTITYTGRTTTTITGCSGVAHTHAIGNKVTPVFNYSSSGNIAILVSGMTNDVIQMALAVPTHDYGFPGVPALFSVSTIAAGVAGALQVNVKIIAPAGIEQTFTNLGITPVLLTRPGTVLSGDTTISIQPLGSISVQQRDQGLVQRLRALPVNRKVADKLTGFTWGEYRWRDGTTLNAHEILDTRWDIDADELGIEKFTSGVASTGELSDLQPIDFEASDNSIYLRIKKGQYFANVERSYLSADSIQLEFLAANATQFSLQGQPRPQTPMFVGNWRLNSRGFYKNNNVYKYTFNTLDPTADFTFNIDRKNQSLTLNKSLDIISVLVGVLSGETTEFFDLPIYPVDKITSLYIDNPRTDIKVYTFSREEGTIQFPKVNGTVAGQPVYAICSPAIAVLYEAEDSNTLAVKNTSSAVGDVLVKDTRLVPVDLNPAFSGLAQGYVYLQHRRFEAANVTLAADKSRIAVPASLSTVTGLIAYGPVFYNGDYVLLSGKASSLVPNEVVPGAKLQVIPGGLNPSNNLPYLSTPFRGLINGQNPNTETIIVTTGGDGIVNLVYTPEPDFGYYIPNVTPWLTTGSVARDTIQLPTPIPISQIHDAGGWLVNIYRVESNDPLFGLDGGDPANGQIPFMINGVSTGAVSISSVSRASNIATYNLLNVPVGLVVGQLVVTTGCTTSGYNGTFKVLSIAGNSITTATTIAGTASENESGALFKYSNFRSNGVLRLISTSGIATAPTQAFDLAGNNYTAGGFDGNVVKLKYGASLPTDSFTKAYFVQFLERQVIQLQVVGSTVLSNTIMLQMQTPEQAFDNLYLVLSNQTGVIPYFAGADVDSRLNINRLGITIDSATAPLTDRSTFAND